MSSESYAVKCAECGRDLSEEIKVNPKTSCPDCGSRTKNHFSTIEAQLHLSVDVSSKVIDPSGFVKQEERTKSSKSEKTGRPVKTTINVDRRDPDVTKVTHKVEGLDEHGIFYKTIHEDIKEGSAKHRPKKKE
ncbi:MAG: hypothetical protein QMD46_03860 [Methanomicrobiales archaeon]|nr:hypothetical protein [Methanomicrobiales archaeon]MDI6876808.1 hypothetical protein [Methanomicrobiales archaeon]